MIEIFCRNDAVSLLLLPPCPPMERERFSGGRNLSAIERNTAKRRAFLGDLDARIENVREAQLARARQR
jgi:hypothetical protein